MRKRIVAAIVFAVFFAPRVLPAQRSGSTPPAPGAVPAEGEASQAPQTQEQKDELHARLLMATKRYAEAASAYAKLSAEHPRNASYLNFGGISHMQEGDVDGARKLFERATKVDKTSADSFNNLGTVWFSKKDYKKAIRQYQKAIAAKPGVAGYYTNLGYAYFAEKKTAQASGAFQKALALDPQIFEQSSRTGAVLQDHTVSDRSLFDFMLAKSYAQKGDAANCAVYLRKALDDGYKGWAAMRKDPAFAKVMADPGVEDVLDRAAPRNAQPPAQSPNP